MSGSVVSAVFGTRLEGGASFQELGEPDEAAVPRVRVEASAEPPGSRLSLRPGPARSEAVVRLRIPETGLVLVMAEFTKPGDAPKTEDVSLVVNGIKLWRSVTNSRLVLPMIVTGGSALEFGVRARPRAIHTDCLAWLRFAVFARVDERAGGVAGFKRLDDNVSNLDDAEAWDWARREGFGSIDTEHWLDLAAETYLLAHDRGEIEHSFGKSLPRLIADLRRSRADPALRRYIFFFTPRSGSTALCEIMSKTDCLGHPHEFLDGRVLGFFSLILRAPIGPLPAHDYLDMVSRYCTSSNGVFGFQIEYDRLVGQGERFIEPFLDWPAVYLTRKDLLAQAVSLFFASEGNLWSSFCRDARHPPFDRDRIMVYLKVLLRHMRGFEALFAARGLAPHRLYYEDILADPVRVLRQLAAHIGVDEILLSPCDLESLGSKVTRRAVNDTFARRVLSEGGETFGYTLFERDGETIAVLAGLDISDLPRYEHRQPLVFRGPDREAIRAAIRSVLESAW